MRWEVKEGRGQRVGINDDDDDDGDDYDDYDDYDDDDSDNDKDECFMDGTNDSNEGSCCGGSCGRQCRDQSHWAQILTISQPASRCGRRGAFREQRYSDW